MGSHALGNVLFFYSHQGLSGKSGPRGERGPTVSAEEREASILRSKGVYWGFLTTPLFSSRVHEVSGVPEVPLGSLELRLVVSAGLLAICPLAHLPTNSSDLRKARKHLL